VTPDEPPVPDEIEFLGLAEPSHHESETVSTTPSRRNALAVVAALVVAALGIAGLAASGSDETTPSTTAPATPTTAPDRAEEQATIRRSDDGPTAAVGAGPTLVWQRVETSTDATNFAWVGDSFYATGGAADVLIRPGPGGASLTLLGASDESIDRSIVSSTEVFSRSPTNPDVLYFPTNSRLQTLDIVPIAPPRSDLVELSTTLAVERLGDRVLVLQTTLTVLDVEQFRLRFETSVDTVFDVTLSASSITVEGGDQSEDLPIADLDLSTDELQALRSLGQSTQVLSAGTIGGDADPVVLAMDRVDWLAVVGDEFVIGGDRLWRSPNGVDWEEALGDTPRFGGLNPPGPDGVLTGLAFEGDDGFLTTSSDAGRSWARQARPMQNTWATTSAFPIVAMTGWQEESFVPSIADWVVLAPSFELRIVGDAERFELLDRSGTLILSGAPSDPSTGFRFVPGSPDVWFVDPRSGEEIARFPQSVFASAFAAARTLDGEPQLVAFADLTSPGDETLEWSLMRVDELFGPQALAVDFIAGADWLLANVTTVTGRDLYVAEVPLGVARPASERRHPTHGEMSRDDAQGD